MSIIRIFLIIILYVNVIDAKDTECPETNKNITAGLITDNFYNYESYLHYALGNYTNINNSKYTLEIIGGEKSSYEDYDIIFGDYFNLKNINKISDKISTPTYIDSFYKKNNIKDLKVDNLYPLDLDTFILVSEDKIEEIKYEDDLYKFSDNLKYTISQSYYSQIENIKFISYLFNDSSLDLNHPLFEKILFEQKKKYTILNKNTFLSKYEELLISFTNKENIFQLNTDGYAYKNNLNFIYYPNYKTRWDDDVGKFTKEFNSEFNPSFYGFSTHINNPKVFSFLCFIMQPDQRDILINSFDLGISPFSANDINDPDIINSNYKKLLNSKSSSIRLIDNELDNFLYEDYLNFIVKKDLTIFSKSDNGFF